MDKKIIIVSAINFTEGGPLSILNDCLDFLSENLSSCYQIIALVHSKAKFRQTNILFYEFPKSKRSWVFRLYYEYYYFKKISLELKPFLWLSLHDDTPNVIATKRVVYCHNASLFYKLDLAAIRYDIKFPVFNLFYYFVYKINIQKNDFIVVQQQWVRAEFCKRFKIPFQKIIVAHPYQEKEHQYEYNEVLKSKVVFFYPALGRVFKNFEVVLKACNYLEQEGIDNFEVILTIDGSENKYTSNLIKQNSHLTSVKFIGTQTRDSVFALYMQCDCLIFASKLETWGLPISEFKAFCKPILLVNLPYARETLGNYERVCFFKQDDYQELAHLMKALINKKLSFSVNKSEKIDFPYAENWSNMFKIILDNN